MLSDIEMSSWIFPVVFFFYFLIIYTNVVKTHYDNHVNQYLSEQ